MSRSAAHRAPSARSLLSPVTVLKVMATLVVAITLALLATTGSYAYLTSSAPVKLLPGGNAGNVTITAGTASLAVTSAEVNLAALYPGVTRSGDVTVAATGTVGLALSISSTTGTSTTGYSITVAPGLCSANRAAVATGSIGVTVVPGTPTSLCVRVELSTSSPASAVNKSTPLTVVIAGAQA